jgi:hypothetical protein
MFTVNEARERNAAMRAIETAGIGALVLRTQLE